MTLAGKSEILLEGSGRVFACEGLEDVVMGWSRSCGRGIRDSRLEMKVGACVDWDGGKCVG